MPTPLRIQCMQLIWAGGCAIYKLQRFYCIRHSCTPAATCEARVVIKKSEHQRCPSFCPHTCSPRRLWNISELRAYATMEKSSLQKGLYRLEDFTLSLLAKFKNKLSAIKEKTQNDAEETSSTADDDVNTDDCYKFGELPALATVQAVIFLNQEEKEEMKTLVDTERERMRTRDERLRGGEANIVCRLLRSQFRLMNRTNKVVRDGIAWKRPRHLSPLRLQLLFGTRKLRAPRDKSIARMGHKLHFEDKGAVLAKDASTKGDDWFDIYDPRNPLNKRKREESDKKMRKLAKK
ncbi:Peptidyl-prolyl cis-trans isomerase CWC27 homolog [Eumeta japonica]|uniref:Peptidyl-prolyl cis-trans isomerase CWC27 homolog n=1 Tax=Eumeta variegata TaxID=151549 RepID=A0A4C1ZRG6_EUMVA|nr:Peptidyl-prolyl cis-trans isomerase CWC27 homolog [Eumeta japonica]